MKPVASRLALFASLTVAGALTAAAQSPPAPRPIPVQAATAEIGVGVELVLAVDVSRSVDPAEQLIQRRGYAGALRSPEVQEAILNGGWGRVAITYVEWAGMRSQTVMVPWTMVDSREAAEALAARIEAAGLTGASRTSISGAIGFSAGLFDGNGFAGMRRVIDVSGDGPNNEGALVTEARDAAVARGITINGLPLMTNDPDDSSLYGNWGSIPDLDRYYADCVIGGAGAFTVPVTGWDQFAAAVRKKLVLELAGLPRTPGTGQERLIRAQDAAAMDCQIGERLREQRERQWRD